MYKGVSIYKQTQSRQKRLNNFKNDHNDFSQSSIQKPRKRKWLVCEIFDVVSLRPKNRDRQKGSPLYLKKSVHEFFCIIRLVPTTRAPRAVLIFKKRKRALRARPLDFLLQ